MEPRSLVNTYEKPMLRDPVLIEGLPGIGFVANLAALHLIKRLKARKICDIKSPYFKPIAVITRDGLIKHPLNSLYYVHCPPEAKGDLIILYGNIQPLTFKGQSELSNTVLDIASELGCETVITLGGLSTPTPSKLPRVYYTASHPDIVLMLKGMGLTHLSGRIYGAAGVLIGLAKLRGMRGLCLLGEVKGFNPSPESAREVLKVLTRLLKFKVDLTGIEDNLTYIRENVIPLS